MPPKLNVAGSVELSGHEVCLRLAPTSMSSASTSATVPTLSLLDKQPPSTMDIMAQIQQWCGLVERGRPETLVLHRLKPNLTPKRAPGPGPIRKIEWRPLAKKHLEHRKIIFHTDSARSYKLKLEDVYHDHVVHQKKRVKVKGKWTWRLPTYVKTVVHELPDGQKLRVKAGTQVIDRCWRYLKDRIVINQYSRAGSSALRAKLRSAQWCYWHRNDDCGFRLELCAPGPCLLFWLRPRFCHHLLADPMGGSNGEGLIVSNGFV